MAFIKNLVLTSGSLKDMAAKYGVTYPTVRLRLDRLIEKIRMHEDEEAEPYVKLVKKLALDDRLDFETAKLFISAYKKKKIAVSSGCCSRQRCQYEGGEKRIMMNVMFETIMIGSVFLVPAAVLVLLTNCLSEKKSPFPGLLPVLLLIVAVTGMNLTLGQVYGNEKR